MDKLKLGLKLPSLRRRQVTDSHETNGHKSPRPGSPQKAAAAPAASPKPRSRPASPSVPAHPEEEKRDASGKAYRPILKPKQPSQGVEQPPAAQKPTNAAPQEKQEQRPAAASKAAVPSQQPKLPTPPRRPSPSRRVAPSVVSRSIDLQSKFGQEGLQKLPPAASQGSAPAAEGNADRAAQGKRRASPPKGLFYLGPDQKEEAGGRADGKGAPDEGPTKEGKQPEGSAAGSSGQGGASDAGERREEQPAGEQRPKEPAEGPGREAQEGGAEERQGDAAAGNAAAGSASDASSALSSLLSDKPRPSFLDRVFTAHLQEEHPLVLLLPAEGGGRGVTLRQVQRSVSTAEDTLGAQQRGAEERAPLVPRVRSVGASMALLPGEEGGAGGLADRDRLDGPAERMGTEEAAPATALPARPAGAAEGGAEGEQGNAASSAAAQVAAHAGPAKEAAGGSAAAPAGAAAAAAAQPVEARGAGGAIATVDLLAELDGLDDGEEEEEEGAGGAGPAHHNSTSSVTAPGPDAPGLPLPELDAEVEQLAEWLAGEPEEDEAGEAPADMVLPSAAAQLPGPLGAPALPAPWSLPGRQGGAGAGLHADAAAALSEAVEEEFLASCLGGEGDSFEVASAVSDLPLSIASELVTTPRTAGPPLGAPLRIRSLEELGADEEGGEEAAIREAVAAAMAAHEGSLASVEGAAAEEEDGEAEVEDLLREWEEEGELLLGAEEGWTNAEGSAAPAPASASASSQAAAPTGESRAVERQQLPEPSSAAAAAAARPEQEPAMAAAPSAGLRITGLPFSSSALPKQGPTSAAMQAPAAPSTGPSYPEATPAAAAATPSAASPLPVPAPQPGARQGLALFSAPLQPKAPRSPAPTDTLASRQRVAAIALQHFPLLWPPEEEGSTGGEGEGGREEGDDMGGVGTLRTPPGALRHGAAAAAGADRVVLYVTSLQSIRATYSACQRLKNLLKGERLSFEERDVVQRPAFRRQLRAMLPASFLLPQLFVCGHHLGSADDVLALHEEGLLAPVFAYLRAVQGRDAGRAQAQGQGQLPAARA